MMEAIDLIRGWEEIPHQRDRDTKVTVALFESIISMSAIDFTGRRRTPYRSAHIFGGAQVCQAMSAIGLVLGDDDGPV